MKSLLKKSWRIIVFAAILAGCVYVLRPGYQRYVEQKKEVERLEAEIKQLEAEHDRLEQQKQALSDEDPEQIERLAREKLHLTKPGETLFRFKKKPETTEIQE
ncbi:MAG: septum formation initiator family protein [Candidatus Abyssobacteria bacterium SURF_5]|uniref:Septum formation initiator family protein n=1 Tax=Abyssobacteria bacterium (strain SURF_5) TaxID=2093360 RepID=A0A3A4P064_ABYX5|nr:MAG: septum formation initiator family protein [Candidatus Abyssubacteria bacterium SURF_5]